MLFKNQMTEEVHESSHDDSPGKFKKQPEKIFFKSGICASVQYLTAKVQVAIHEAERLPRNFVPDILTPPPNLFS